MNNKHVFNNKMSPPFKDPSIMYTAGHHDVLDPRSFPPMVIADPGVGPPRVSSVARGIGNGELQTMGTSDVKWLGKGVTVKGMSVIGISDMAIAMSPMNRRDIYDDHLMAYSPMRIISPVYSGTSCYSHPYNMASRHGYPVATGAEYPEFADAQKTWPYHPHSSQQSGKMSKHKSGVESSSDIKSTDMGSITFQKTTLIDPITGETQSTVRAEFMERRQSALSKDRFGNFNSELLQRPFSECASSDGMSVVVTDSPEHRRKTTYESVACFEYISSGDGVKQKVESAEQSTRHARCEEELFKNGLQADIGPYYESPYTEAQRSNRDSKRKQSHCKNLFHHESELYGRPSSVDTPISRDNTASHELDSNANQFTNAQTQGESAEQVLKRVLSPVIGPYFESPYTQSQRSNVNPQRKPLHRKNLFSDATELSGQPLLAESSVSTEIQSPYTLGTDGKACTDTPAHAPCVEEMLLNNYNDELLKKELKPALGAHYESPYTQSRRSIINPNRKSHVKNLFSNAPEHSGRHTSMDTPTYREIQSPNNVRPSENAYTDTPAHDERADDLLENDEILRKCLEPALGPYFESPYTQAQRSIINPNRKSHVKKLFSNAPEHYGRHTSMDTPTYRETQPPNNVRPTENAYVDTPADDEKADDLLKNEEILRKCLEPALGPYFESPYTQSQRSRNNSLHHNKLFSNTPKLNEHTSFKQPRQNLSPNEAENKENASSAEMILEKALQPDLGHYYESSYTLSERSNRNSYFEHYAFIENADCSPTNHIGFTENKYTATSTHGEVANHIMGASRRLSTASSEQESRGPDEKSYRDSLERKEIPSSLDTEPNKSGYRDGQHRNQSAYVEYLNPSPKKIPVLDSSSIGKHLAKQPAPVDTSVEHGLSNVHGDSQSEETTCKDEVLSVHKHMALTSSPGGELKSSERSPQSSQEPDDKGTSQYDSSLHENESAGLIANASIESPGPNGNGFAASQGCRVESLERPKRGRGRPRGSGKKSSNMTRSEGFTSPQYMKITCSTPIQDIVSPQTTKRGRGRPLKRSTTLPYTPGKSGVGLADELSPPPAKRGRGRPRGSFKSREASVVSQYSTPTRDDLIPSGINEKNNDVFNLIAHDSDNISKTLGSEKCTDMEDTRYSNYGEESRIENLAGLKPILKQAEICQSQPDVVGIFAEEYGPLDCSQDSEVTFKLSVNVSQEEQHPKTSSSTSTQDIGTPKTTKRGRGRPRKWSTTSPYTPVKSGVGLADGSSPQPAKRGRGRPRGSCKNRAASVISEYSTPSRTDLIPSGISEKINEDFNLLAHDSDNTSKTPGSEKCIDIEDTSNSNHSEERHTEKTPELNPPMQQQSGQSQSQLGGIFAEYGTLDCSQDSEVAFNLSANVSQERQPNGDTSGTCCVKDTSGMVQLAANTQEHCTILAEEYGTLDCSQDSEVALDLSTNVSQERQPNEDTSGVCSVKDTSGMGQLAANTQERCIVQTKDDKKTRQQAGTGVIWKPHFELTNQTETVSVDNERLLDNRAREHSSGGVKRLWQPYHSIDSWDSMTAAWSDSALDLSINTQAVEQNREAESKLKYSYHSEIDVDGLGSKGVPNDSAESQYHQKTYRDIAELPVTDITDDILVSRSTEDTVRSEVGELDEQDASVVPSQEAMEREDKYRQLLGTVKTLKQHVRPASAGSKVSLASLKTLLTEARRLVCEVTRLNRFLSHTAH